MAVTPWSGRVGGVHQSLSRPNGLRWRGQGQEVMTVMCPAFSAARQGCFGMGVLTYLFPFADC
ncbi:MAG: hypothetical protein VKI93_03220 [Synechococcus sp.]|nr:hypothetical protein [Synechococcus sp.]